MKNLIKFLVVFFGLLLLCSLVILCNAQNLIQNGDFEKGNIPTGTGQHAYKWSVAGGSPDYCHQFATVMSGVNIPHHFAGDIPKAFEGIACMGVCNYMENWDNFREYPCQKLQDSLIIGQTYEFEMYVLTEKNPCIYGHVSITDFGVLFSTIKPKKGVNHVINWQTTYTLQGYLYAPQWRKISFRFVADSAYKYLTFGCYVDDMTQQRHKTGMPMSYNCSYVFVDNVSLKRKDGAYPITTEERPKMLYHYLLGQTW